MIIKLLRLLFHIPLKVAVKILFQTFSRKKIRNIVKGTNARKHLVLLSASIGKTDDSFDGAETFCIKPTWDPGDQLTVFNKSNGYQIGALTLISGEGKKSGLFIGHIHVNLNDDLFIVYPNSNLCTQTLDDYRSTIKTACSNQTQTGNVSTMQFRNSGYMYVQTSFCQSQMPTSVTFTSAQALLTLKVSRPSDWIPDDGNPTRFNISIGARKYTLHILNCTCWSIGKELIASLVITPPDISTNKNLKCQVITEGSDLFCYSGAISKTYLSGIQYSRYLDPIKRVNVFFSITVKTDAQKSVNNLAMTLPFNGSVPAGTTLTIDWGGKVFLVHTRYHSVGITIGNVTILPGGTDVTNLTANYAVAGTYTIKISSSAPVNLQQMPDFRFNNSGDCAKLISLNSAMLNTGSSGLNHSFYGCINLVSISEDLFNNNIAATNFSGCFSKCTKLTTIPENLFYKNTKVTTFSFCFSDCISLATIPAGLFSNNMEVTNFSFCFNNCRKAIVAGDPFIGGTTTPKNRFGAITNGIIDFSNCFYRVASNVTVSSKGNAPELWNYIFKAGVIIKSGLNYCFYRSCFDNNRDIPGIGNRSIPLLSNGVPGNLRWK